MDRLDKIISEHSRFSRREAQALIKKGAVRVRGILCTDASLKFDISEMDLMIHEEAIPLRAANHLMLNKPGGYISATEDPKEKTVLDLIAPEDQYPLPSPAGRLDKDTSGLLLLTSDGALCHRIISPKKEVYKTYLVETEGPLLPADIQTLREGLVLSSGEAFLPAYLTILEKGEKSRGELKIREGKYHQVKLMMSALGKPVLSLKRTAIGGLVLDESLSPGQYKRLSEEEISRIFLPESDPVN